MSISGCQVEPIGSLYEWEREPLAIIKDGCQVYFCIDTIISVIK